MSSALLRKVHQSKVDLAIQELRENPTIKVTEFCEKYDISGETGRAAIHRARRELTEREDGIANRARRVRERQQQEALRVLEDQCVRLQEYPAILLALRQETFIFNDSGEITGIREHIKSYNKTGDPVFLTPGSIVKEYLAAEKDILDHERTITGIAAAERMATAREGKTDLTLQIPATPEQIEGIKPISR